MRDPAIPLRIRVIVVSTHAALRHARMDGDGSEAILGRGRELLDGLGQTVREEGTAADLERLDEAYAALDAMADA